MFVIMSSHGISISIFQHPTTDNHEDERPNADDIHQSQGSLSFIIILCTNIPSAPFPKTNPTPTKGHAMASTFLPACTRDLAYGSKWIEVRLTANDQSIMQLKEKVLTFP